MGSIELIVLASAVAAFALAWIAGRWAPPVILTVAPGIWIAATVVFVARGQIESIRDVLGAAGGFFVILIVSGAGRAARSKAEARSVRDS